MSNFFGGKDRRAARNAANQAQLQSLSFTGPGGSSAFYDPSSGRGGVSVGDLGPVRASLLGAISDRLGAGGGIDPFLGAMAMGSIADLFPSDLSSLASALPQLGGLGTFVAPQLAPQQFMAPDEANFAAGLGGLRESALSNLGIINADPFELAQDRLSLLREQAQPFEERAFSALQDRLFSQGRLGSTGGALQIEAFARGLGQADIERQLAAADYARGLQSDALGRLQGLLGEERAAAGLQEALTQGQFGRALQGFGANLESLFGTFDRSLAGAESQFAQNMAARLAEFEAGGMNFDRLLNLASLQENTRAQRALDRFGIADRLFGNTMQADQQRFAQALQGLSTIAGMDTGMLNLFAQALQAEQARSAAALGRADAFGNIARNSLGSQLGSFFGNVFEPIPWI